MKFQLLSIAACLALIQVEPITEAAVENPVAHPSGALITFRSMIDCSWP